VGGDRLVWPIQTAAALRTEHANTLYLAAVLSQGTGDMGTLTDTVTASRSMLVESALAASPDFNPDAWPPPEAPSYWASPWASPAAAHYWASPEGAQVGQLLRSINALVEQPGPQAWLSDRPWSAEASRRDHQYVANLAGDGLLCPDRRIANPEDLSPNFEEELAALSAAPDLPVVRDRFRRANFALRELRGSARDGLGQAVATLHHGRLFAAVAERQRLAGDLEAACDSGESALTCFTSVDVKPMAAQAHRDLAAVYRRLGNQPLLDHHQQQAVRLDLEFRHPSS